MNEDILVRMFLAIICQCHLSFITLIPRVFQTPAIQSGDAATVYFAVSHFAVCHYLTITLTHNPDPNPIPNPNHIRDSNPKP